VRRTPIRAATAAKAAIAAAAAGGLIVGCAPVKMGAAATVGSERITIGQLDSEVSQLNKAYQPYANAVQLTAAQMPKEVLSWLIRFQVRDDMARAEGLSVSRTQEQQALADIYSQAQAQAAQAGVNNVSLNELAVANGLPPDLLNQLGHYQAIEIAYAENKNGGKLPTATSKVNAITTEFNKAECLTYKSQPVAVNPQFGTMNYSQGQYSVVAAPDTLSRAQGSSSGSSSSGSSPSC